jgi:membrane associated rhomboid family serine protease
VGRDVVFDHEWWRLITCLFIHQGIIHLLFNMFVLRMLGPATENFYGKARFVLIYFGSGIFASLASLFGHGLATFSVGASGAIMGLLGALAIYGRRRGDAMGQALFRQTSIWALMILGLGLLLPQFRTDNWAHAGGLVAGVALGAVFSGRALVQRVEGPRERLSALSTLAIAGICLLLGFTHLVIGGQKDSDRLLAAQRVWPQYRHYVSVLAQLPDGRSAAIKAEDARAMASFAPVFRGAAEALGEEGEWLLPLVEEQTKLRDLLQWDRPEGEIRDQARRVGKMMDTAPWGKQLPP